MDLLRRGTHPIKHHVALAAKQRGHCGGSSAVGNMEDRHLGGHLEHLRDDVLRCPVSRGAVGQLVGIGFRVGDQLTHIKRKLWIDDKDVYAIGAYDLLKGFDVAGKSLSRTVETYVVAAIFYSVIGISLSRIVRRIHSRIEIVR